MMMMDSILAEGGYMHGWTNVHGHGYHDMDIPYGSTQDLTRMQRPIQYPREPHRYYGGPGIAARAWRNAVTKLFVFSRPTLNLMRSASMPYDAAWAPISF